MIPMILNWANPGGQSAEGVIPPGENSGFDTVFDQGPDGTASGELATGQAARPAQKTDITAEMIAQSGALVAPIVAVPEPQARLGDSVAVGVTAAAHVLLGSAFDSGSDMPPDIALGQVDPKGAQMGEIVPAPGESLGNLVEFDPSLAMAQAAKIPPAEPDPMAAGQTRPILAQPVQGQNDLVQNDLTQNDLAQNDPSPDLANPVVPVIADQVMAVHSAGDQRGAVQTGTLQTGTFQTGTGQTGTFQTGTLQTGAGRDAMTQTVTGPTPTLAAQGSAPDDSPLADGKMPIILTIPAAKHGPIPSLAQTMIQAQVVGAQSPDADLAAEPAMSAPTMAPQIAPQIAPQFAPQIAAPQIAATMARPFVTKDANDDPAKDMFTTDQPAHTGPVLADSNQNQSFTPLPIQVPGDPQAARPIEAAAIGATLTGADRAPQVQPSAPLSPNGTHPALGAQILPHAAAAQTGPVELLLNPAELGHVRFEIHQKGDHVQVVLSAERPETLDLLRRNTDQLTAEFRDAGFSGSALSFGQWGRNTDDRAAPARFAADTGDDFLPQITPEISPAPRDPARNLNLRL